MITKHVCLHCWVPMTDPFSYYTFIGSGSFSSPSSKYGSLTGEPYKDKFMYISYQLINERNNSAVGAGELKKELHSECKNKGWKA